MSNELTESKKVLNELFEREDMIEVHPKDYFDSFVEVYSHYTDADLDDTKGIIQDYMKSISDKTKDRPIEYQGLIDKWIDSDCTDFSVYDDDLYALDGWACWALYSRRYLRDINKSLDNGKFPVKREDIKKIIDVGCGISMATVGLTKVFPGATVVGTNIEGTGQIEYARSISEDMEDVTFTGEDELEPTSYDLLFASEYFEHFKEPIEHLKFLLEKCDPKVMVIQNTFNQPEAVGHFPSYSIKGEDDEFKEENGRTTSRLFNKYLKDNGYERHKLYWNDSPSVFVKIEEK